jgi:prolipoprotein diacylglyceryltransferase
MIGMLERTLLAARTVAFPGVWILAQISAAVLALSYVAVRTRRWPPVRSFGIALVAGMVGAFAWGLLCRLLDRLTGSHVELVGVSAYGALMGVTLAFVSLARRHGLTALASLDLIAPALALLVGVGRLGCLLAGCDAGRVTASAFSVRFPAGSAVFRDHVARGFVLATDRWSLAVHPAQLYEAGLVLTLAFLGHRLGVRRAASGLSFGVTALGYALARSFADALRFPGKSATYGLITSALVSIAVVFVLLRNRKHLPDTSLTQLPVHGEPSLVDPVSSGVCWSAGGWRGVSWRPGRRG